MFFFWVFGVAEPTVGGDLMMEGVAPSTNLRIRSSTWFLVTGPAIESHGRVGLVGELADLRKKELFRTVVMAERTVGGWDVVKLMTRHAAFLAHGHGGTLMTEIASEAHLQMGVVEEAPVAEGQRIPGRCLMAKPACPRGL
jgi:hypothetical protein